MEHPHALSQRALEWRALLLGAGAKPAQMPDDDRLEEYWRAYFSSIFNPARLKVVGHDIGNAEEILAQPA